MAGRYDRIPLNSLGNSDEEDIEIPHFVPQFTLPRPTWRQRLITAFNPKTNLIQLFAPEPSDSQLQVLDCVRSIAIIWVILFHSWVFLQWGHQLDPTLGSSFEMRAVRSGEFSVDTFFTLSGFLMAYILIREYAKNSSISFLQFYLRRWLRIFPAMGFVLAIYWPVFNSLGCDNCGACNQYGWMNLLFINNFGPAIGGCMAWTWSVAVEMQFYLFSPFVMLLYVKRQRWGLALLAFLLVVSLVVRGSVLYVTGLYKPGFDIGTFMDTIFSKPYHRVGPYLLGMLTACVWSQMHSEMEGMRLDWKHVFARWAALIGSWTVIAVLVILGEGNPEPMDELASFFFWWLLRHAYGVSVAVIIFCVLMSHTMPPGNIVSRLWQRGVDYVISWRLWFIIAQLSYSAFLLHPIFITIFYLVLPSSLVVNFWWFILLCIANILGSNILAMVVYLIVEKPIMNLR